MSVSASKKRLKNHENGLFFGDFPKKQIKDPKRGKSGKEVCWMSEFTQKNTNPKPFRGPYQLYFALMIFLNSTIHKN